MISNGRWELWEGSRMESLVNMFFGFLVDFLRFLSSSFSCSPSHSLTLSLFLFFPISFSPTCFPFFYVIGMVLKWFSVFFQIKWRGMSSFWAICWSCVYIYMYICAESFQHLTLNAGLPCSYRLSRCMHGKTVYVTHKLAVCFSIFNIIYTIYIYLFSSIGKSRIFHTTPKKALLHLLFSCIYCTHSCHFILFHSWHLIYAALMYHSFSFTTFIEYSTITKQGKWKRESKKEKKNNRICFWLFVCVGMWGERLESLAS